MTVSFSLRLRGLFLGWTLVFIAAFSLPASFAHDGRGQANHAYDGNYESGFAYDAASVLTTRKMECRTIVYHVLLSKFAGFLAAKNEVTVYRVFGGDSRAQGFSWTTKDPRTVANFRDAAGLPSGGASGANNTADFLIQGKVNPADIIKSRPALPLDGNKGGLLEHIIDPKNVKLTDFSVLKP